jgi:hypothetical protein
LAWLWNVIRIHYLAKYEALIMLVRQLFQK